MALEADYVTAVEGRPTMSAEYCLPLLVHPAALFVICRGVES